LFDWTSPVIPVKTGNQEYAANRLDPGLRRGDEMWDIRRGGVLSSFRRKPGPRALWMPVYIGMTGVLP
jgi:hypothetical protein